MKLSQLALSNGVAGRLMLITMPYLLNAATYSGLAF
jgi:hypothetical protein